VRKVRVVDPLTKEIRDYDPWGKDLLNDPQFLQTPLGFSAAEVMASGKGKGTRLDALAEIMTTPISEINRRLREKPDCNVWTGLPRSWYEKHDPSIFEVSAKDRRKRR
jgi:hypothetical protein